MVDTPELYKMFTMLIMTIIHDDSEYFDVNITNDDENDDNDSVVVDRNNVTVAADGDDGSDYDSDDNKNKMVFLFFNDLTKT